MHAAIHVGQAARTPRGRVRLAGAATAGCDDWGQVNRKQKTGMCIAWYLRDEEAVDVVNLEVAERLADRA
jgi:hypothetical protein